MRLLALLLGWFLLPCGLYTRSAYASEQVLFQFTTAISTSAENFGALIGDSGAGSTEVLRSCIASSGGTFSSLRVVAATAPQNGVGTQQYTVTLYIDGSATSLSLVLSEDEVVDQDLVNTASITAGQTYSLSTTPSGTPIAPGTLTASVQFDGSTAAESLVCGSTSANVNQSAAAARFIGLYGGQDTPDATESRYSMPWPTSGTFKNLRVTIEGDPDNGAGTQEYAYVLMVDGSPSALTTTISDGETTDTDLVNTVAVTAGQLVDLRVTPANTPVALEVRGIGLTFLADTDGEFVIPMTSFNDLSGTAARYLRMDGSGLNATETEEDQVVAVAFTMKGFYLHLDGTPGAGNSYQFDLRQNTGAGAGDTAITETMSDVEVTENFFTDVTINAADLLDTESTPSSNPSARTVKIAYLGFIDQGGAAQQQYYLMSQEERCAPYGWWPRACWPRS